MPSEQDSSDHEPRRFRTDPLKLRRLRVAAGLSVADFKTAAGLDRTTAGNVLGGKPVFLKSITKVARKVFGIDDNLELLHPDELAALGVRCESTSPDQVLEWRIASYLSEWKKTSNGLQYQLARLEHRFLEGREARGKCYELRHLTNVEKDRLEQRLRRHIEVCERVGSQPNLADNLTAAEIGGLWWVVDRWEAGETLAARLEREGPLGQYTLRHILTGIAEGLHALHRTDVVRRELTPDQVILREADDRPVLTDLELAKLTDGEPTVSPEDWPYDDYRALEVGGEAKIDARADLYSWGRIFVHAANGSLPDRGEETLGRTDVPEPVRRFVLQCVAMPRSKRPPNATKLLKALRAWA